MAKTLKEMMTLNKLPLNNKIDPTLSIPTARYAYRKIIPAEPLGAGARGDVYPHTRGNKVVKIYAPHDTEYTRLVQHAKANPDDPHLPKIYGHGTLKTGNKVVSMEKLKPLEDYNDDWSWVDHLTASGTIHDIHRRLNDPTDEVSNKLKVDYPSVHASLSKIIDNEIQHGNKNSYLDAHRGNFMRRPSDNSLVFTDILESKSLEEMMTLNKLPLGKDTKKLRHDELDNNGLDYSDEIHARVLRHYDAADRAKLGAGAFGVTYSRNKNPTKVFKLYSNDPAYDSYVDYARKNQHNPHVPKIYGKKEANSGHFTAVTIEKLKPVEHDNEYDQHVINTLARTAAFKKGSSLMDHINNDTHVNKEMKTLPGKLYDTIKDIAQNHPNDMFDVHSGNIMKRYVKGGGKFGLGHYEYVLTDPLAEQTLEELATKNTSKVMNSLKNVAHHNAYTEKNLKTNFNAQNLGSGAAGGVYDRGHSVIKVFNDDNYKAFARYAHSKNDLHLPKINSIVKINDKGLHAAKMEKLLPLEYNHPIVKHLADLGFESHLHGSAPVSGVESNVSQPIDTGIGMHHILNNTESGKRLKEQFPTIHNTIANLASRFPYHYFDLHSSNVMKRENGDVVITDPLLPSHMAEDTVNEMVTLSIYHKINEPDLQGGFDSPGNIFRKSVEDIVRSRGSEDTKSKSKIRYQDVKTGHFATVVPSTKNTVLKFSYDKAYNDFASHAKQNQDDPHMPRIHAVKKAGKLQLTKMEKLRDFDNDPRYSDIRNNFSHHGYRAQQTGAEVALSHNKNTWLKTNHPTLHASIGKLLNKFPDRHFDLHMGNLMTRPGTNDIVITDPIIDKKYLDEMMTLNKLPAVQNAEIKRSPSAAIARVLGKKTKSNGRFLGQGYFGVAYNTKTPSNSVIKVSKDAGYHEYAQYAASNRDDPHLPKIHSIKSASNGINAYRMEKLEPVKSFYGPENADARTVYDIWSRATDRAIGAGEPPIKGRVVPRGHHIDDILYNTATGNHLAAHYPNLYDSLSNLASKFSDHKFDLHIGNMMRRKDTGHLVLTDPVYVADELKAKKNRNLKEDAPTNNVGDGHIAGLGVGPQGEPPINNSKILRRKKPVQIVSDLRTT